LPDDGTPGPARVLRITVRITDAGECCLEVQTAHVTVRNILTQTWISPEAALDLLYGAVRTRNRLVFEAL